MNRLKGCSVNKLNEMRKNQRDMAKRKKNKRMKTDHHPNPYLPQEIVIDKILTRLPSKTLIRFGCVCKLWYKTIHSDPRFASSHFLQSQKKPCLIFHFLNIKHRGERSFSNYLFWSEDKKEDNADDLLRRDAKLTFKCRRKELVGYCNGLVCLLNNRRIHDRWAADIEIINPTLLERFWKSGAAVFGHVIGYGFGFDSALTTGEYKVVLITYSDIDGKFKSYVFTLGTKSWREITCPPRPLEMWTIWPDDSKSAAIFCGGALFWKSTIESREILLSFDLHDETYQVIQLPADCVSKTTEPPKLVHLLESNGSLCAAHIEEIVGSDDQNGTGSCQVHLHFLKDKAEEQIWVEESFDILSLSSLPHISNIRLVSFSGRVLLYWFDKSGVKLYDLRMEHLKVVKPAPYDHHLFSKKKPSNMDYQVNSYVDNFNSLRTFLPTGSFMPLPLDLLRHVVSARQEPAGFFLRESGEAFIFI